MMRCIFVQPRVGRIDCWIDLGRFSRGGDIAFAKIHYRDSLTTFGHGSLPFLGRRCIIDFARCFVQRGSIVTRIGDFKAFVPAWRQVLDSVSGRLD